MPIQKFRPSFTFTEERLNQLKQIVPEAFADGKINWEVLREALGDYLEDDEACEEHFGLFWPGKRDARRLAAIPSKGTLIPVPGEGVNEENTHHIFIEGENLEVLKLLQKSYAGRVKMIYIDPPYNTGNDFIYEDDYSEPLEAYLKRTGQMDEEGRRLTTNTKASGRFHSKWLSMIYPRLLLARQLLREDGVIFVSIDDNEIHNLRQIMGEIFGEESFVAIFPWKKRTAKSDVPFGVSQDYEWILCFAKQNFWAGVPYERKYYYTPDFPGDGWRLADLTTQRSATERPNSAFDMIDPKTGKIYPFDPNRVWGVTKETFEKYYSEGKIVFPGDYPFLKIKKPAFRVFESEDKIKAIKKYGTESPMKAVSTELPKEVGRSEDGNKEIVELFGEKIFSYPKPSSLIQYLIQIIHSSEGIILDFFAGSGVTAQAVLQKNREDNGSRQFILVQLPEPTPPDSAAYRSGFSTIAEIGKERIRRVIAKMQMEREGQMDLHPDEDLGFKVFRLERSHFKDWQPVEPGSVSDLIEQMDDAEDPLRPDWKPNELLVEILLQKGFPLDSQIIQLDAFRFNQVHRIHHSDVQHDLFICLDREIRPETVEQLKAVLRTEPQPDIFICLDSAIQDQDKIVLSDRFHLEVI